MEPKEYLEIIHGAASYIKEKINGRQPVAAVILGSGLGKIAERIENPSIIPYKEIPGFPVSTAIGHKGNFIAGDFAGKFIIAMQGRFHPYEGYPMQLVTLPIRVLKLLGIEALFVSNAAGGCNPDFRVGDLMIIKDHINLHTNPLIGQNLDEFGPRFPDMTAVYDPILIAKAESVATEMGFSLQKGVYLSSSGPTYETPAEVRFYRAIGADALGMSTTPEVIVARHCGIRVFGISVITNISNTDTVSKVLNDAEDVVKAADSAAEKMSGLISGIIASM